MNSTVCMRNNHYETLGLKPTASDQEIREGFVRAMRLPHLPAELSQIGIAFDTLRNRAKRRAYDAALGLIPEPRPRIAPSAISLRLSGNFGHLPTASIAQPEPMAIVRELPIQRISRPEESLTKSTSEQDCFGAEVPVPEFLATGANRKQYTPVRKQPVGDWKYSTFALGSLILGVGIIGAWAGAHAQDTPQKTHGSTMIAAPSLAKGTSDALDTPPSSNSSAEPEFVSPAVIERAHERLKARASVDRRPRSGRLESTGGGDADAVEEHPGALAAKLPLPDAVIARTIERIGYACGGVASASAAEGDEPGVYKVTCTSGQSYQARPVHGRYHFRRW